VSKQVFKPRFSGISHLFSEKNERWQKVKSFKDAFARESKYKKRKLISLNYLYNLKIRRLFRVRTKLKLVRNLKFLKYFWFQDRYFKFEKFITIINKLNLFSNNFAFLKKQNYFNIIDKNKLSGLRFVSLIKKNRSIFLFSKLHSIKLNFFNIFVSRLKKFIVWNYYPHWFLRKLGNVIWKKRRFLKRKVLSNYLKTMYKINYPSIFFGSYISLLFKVLYGNMFDILFTGVKLDLQKYVNRKVYLQLSFIGGLSLTPSVLLKYLLYKLARLHLPTEMIPKLLYKFNGFFKKIPVKSVKFGNAATRVKEVFKARMLGLFYNYKKRKTKYIFKYVRAFSPFLKGMFFKCNGRFTRKQDVGSFAF
jgi:hypothetical protein